MYVVEMRFISSGPGIAPSLEVVGASLQRQSGRYECRIEHLKVLRVDERVHVVAFTVAESQQQAGAWGCRVGQAVAADLPNTVFFGCRVWPERVFRSTDPGA
jgi:hypothetical protein